MEIENLGPFSRYKSLFAPFQIDLELRDQCRYEGKFLHLSSFDSVELTCLSFPKTEILLNHILKQKLKEPGLRAFPRNTSS